jgi:uncharacterized protein
MLLESLQADYKQAMIAKDSLAKSALNGMIAIIKNKKIDLQRDPTDDEITKLIQKEIKMLQEGADFYKQAGKDEEYTDEMTKISHLEKYLPSMLDETALKDIVSTYITKLEITDPLKQRGILMNAIKADYGASVDGGVLNGIISGL